MAKMAAAFSYAKWQNFHTSFPLYLNCFIVDRLQILLLVSVPVWGLAHLGNFGWGPVLSKIMAPAIQGANAERSRHVTYFIPASPKPPTGQTKEQLQSCVVIMRQWKSVTIQQMKFSRKSFQVTPFIKQKKQFLPECALLLIYTICKLPRRTRIFLQEGADTSKKR